MEMPSSLRAAQACKYHPGADIIEDYRAGDAICAECGLVVEDRTIDVSVNWRTFGHDDNTKKDSGCRVGSTNPLLNGSDLGTFVEPPSSNDPAAFKSRPSKCFIYETKYYKDLKGAFAGITRIGEHLLLISTTIFKAQQIFKVISEKDMSKSLEGSFKIYKEEVFAACVYIACRQDKVPRTFKEICSASNSGSSFAIGAYYKHIIRLLELKTEKIYPEDFVSRFCAKLILPYEIEKIAFRIVIDVNYLDLFEGHSHVTGVGAAILIASSRTERYRRSLKQVAQICGVSEVSITKARDTLYPYALKTLSQCFPNYAPPVPRALNMEPYGVDQPHPSPIIVSATQENKCVAGKFVYPDLKRSGFPSSFDQDSEQDTTCAVVCKSVLV